MIDFDFVLKTHKKYKDISIEEEITLEQIKEKLNLLLNGDKYNYSYYIELALLHKPISKGLFHNIIFK